MNYNSHLIEKNKSHGRINESMNVSFLYVIHDYLNVNFIFFSEKENWHFLSSLLTKELMIHVTGSGSWFLCNIKFTVRTSLIPDETMLV